MRRRYVYRQNSETGEVEAVEVTADYEPTVRTEISMDRHYENTCATDGTDIGSRRKHQEYMKRHGLAVADDFKGAWAKAAKEREAFYSGNFDKRERREAIGRAAYELRNKRGKHGR